MSQVTRVKCECCDKEVVDPLKHPGWIQILYGDRDSFLLMTYPWIKLTTEAVGSKEEENPRRKIVELKDRADFCSIDHMIEYLQRKMRGC